MSKKAVATRDHDDWFRSQVEQALREADGSRAHFLNHEEVTARWEQRRRELLNGDRSQRSLKSH